MTAIKPSRFTIAAKRVLVAHKRRQDAPSVYQGEAYKSAPRLARRVLELERKVADPTVPRAAVEVLRAQFAAWYEAHGALEGSYQEGKTHGIMHCLEAVEKLLAAPAEWDAFVAVGNAALGRPAPSTPLEERIATKAKATVPRAAVEAFLPLLAGVSLMLDTSDDKESKREAVRRLDRMIIAMGRLTTAPPAPKEPGHADD